MMNINYYAPIQEAGLGIHGVAVDETVSYNDIFYKGEELEKSAHTLIGKPLLKNHENSIDSIVGRVTKATYNPTAKRIEYEADVMEPKYQEMIKDGRINTVSIGARVEKLEETEADGKKFATAIGLEFMELSLVAVQGVPNASLVANNFQCAIAEALKLEQDEEPKKEPEPEKPKEEKKMPEGDMAQILQMLTTIQADIERLKALHAPSEETPELPAEPEEEEEEGEEEKPEFPPKEPSEKPEKEKEEEESAKTKEVTPADLAKGMKCPDCGGTNLHVGGSPARVICDDCGCEFGESAFPDAEECHGGGRKYYRKKKVRHNAEIQIKEVIDMDEAKLKELEEKNKKLEEQVKLLSTEMGKKGEVAVENKISDTFIVERTAKGVSFYDKKLGMAKNAAELIQIRGG